MLAQEATRMLTIEQHIHGMWRQYTTRRLSPENAYRMTWQLAARHPGTGWRVFDDEALEQVGAVVLVGGPESGSAG